MSVDMASIPPWKLAIIEKRRKSEEEEKFRQKELERIGSLPSWKRDILVRKQGQRNTMIFLGRESKSPERDTEKQRHSYTEGANHVEHADKLHNNNFTKGPSGSSVDNSHSKNTLVNGGDSVDRVSSPIHVEIPDDAHIIPVHSNPWVLSDRKSRKSSSTSSGRSFSTGSSHKSSDINHSSISDQSLNNSMSPAAVHQVDTLHVEQNRDRLPSEQIDPNVFTEPEPEVQYGRGFVSKLLQKFRNLSTKEDGSQSEFAPRRTHSMENLLDIEKEHHVVPAPRPKSLHMSNQMSKANSLGNVRAPMSPDEVDAMVRAMSPEPRDRSISPLGLRRSLSPPVVSRERSVSPPSEQRNNVRSPSPRSSNLRSGRSPSPSERRSSYPKHFYFRGADEAKEHKELPRPHYVSSARSLFEEGACVSPTQHDEHVESDDEDDDNYKSEETDFSKTWDLSQSSDHDIIESEIAEPEDDSTASSGGVMLLNYSTISNEYSSSANNTKSHNGFTSAMSSSQKKDINTSVPSAKPVAPARNRKDGPSRTFYAANETAREKLISSNNNSDENKKHDIITQNKPVSGDTAWSRTYTGSGEKTKTTSYNNNSSRISSVDRPKAKHPPLINLDMLEATNIDGSDSSNDKESPPVTSPTAPPRYRKRNSKSTPKPLPVEQAPEPIPEPVKPEPAKPDTRVDMTQPKARDKKPPPVSTSVIYGAKIPVNKPKIPEKSEVLTKSERIQMNSKDSVKLEGHARKEEPVPQKPTPTLKPVELTNKTTTTYSAKPVEPVKTAPQTVAVTKPDKSDSPVTVTPATSSSSNYSVGAGSHTSNGKRSSFSIGAAVKEAKQAKEKEAMASNGGVQLKAVSYRDYSGESFLTPESEMNGGPPSKISRGSANRKRAPRRGRRTPGKLIVKPASNQVTGTNRSSQFNFLNLLKYRDVTKATFENTINSRDHLSSEDLEEIYINDYISTSGVIDGPVPVTNIDDILAEGNQSLKPESFEFIGAGVKLPRSLLDKSRKGKRTKLCFFESVLTYEYPSEASMMEMMPPEPGEPDNHPALSPQSSLDDDDVDMNSKEPGGLRSTPGVGSAGGLANYQTRMQYEYQFGMNRERSAPSAAKPSQNPPQKDTSVKPAEEDVTWSENRTSDLLF